MRRWDIRHRRRRGVLRGQAGEHPRREGRGSSWDRGRLPRPRALRQPRRRSEHVPRPRGARLPATPSGAGDGAKDRRDSEVAGGDDDSLDQVPSGEPLGRAAPVGRSRACGDVELPSRHSRRADRGARGRSDATGARPREEAGPAGACCRPHLAQPPRHLRGRHPDHRAAFGSKRGGLRAGADDSAGDRRSDHGGCAHPGRGDRRAGARERLTSGELETPEVEPQRPQREGLVAIVGGYFERLRGGEVGILPVLFGLGVITLYFYSKNPNYVTAVNFNTVVVQMAGVSIIAMGVVFVLLLGEIDLSVGYVSGIGGVTVALLQQPEKSYQVGGLIAILIAVSVGAAIGAFQGSFVALIGVPSFVVTLAGLLAWQGVVQKAIGDQGVITIQSDTINNVANYSLPANWGWRLATVAAVGYALTVLLSVFSRRRARVTAQHPLLLVLKVVAIAALALLVVALLIFWTYIARRTTFGRHVYAVGGNAEAARRAGISVKRIRIVVFMISSAMAALGGVVFAARLTSVDLNAGGGTILLDAISAAVIGGTSLFGGRGNVRDAVVGALLISAIANGIDLVGYTSATRFIVTGIILLAAVTLDTVLRRRQAAAGR